MLNHNPRIVTNGLVLCLDAANPKSYSGSGTNWKDLSGNGNDGTLVNGVGYSADNKGAMVFDGVNDYINLQNVDTWNSFGDSITVETWFKLEGTSGSFPRLVSKQISGTTTNVSCFQLGIHNTGTFRWSIRTENVFRDDLSVSVQQNIIYHFVGTYNGNSKIAYVNGKEIFSHNMTGNILTSSQPLTLGLSYYNGSIDWEFNGKIYNTKIYDRALSEAEIRQNYNALRGRYGI
jgi:hypothetical protein